MAAFDTSTLQRAFAPAEVFSLLTTKSTPALVLIGGCGGSGKSTLARYLSELSPLPVVHLDDFAQPGVVGWDEQRFDAQVAVPLAHRQAVRLWTDTWMPEEDVYAWSQRPWEFADFVVDGTLAFSG